MSAHTDRTLLDNEPSALDPAQRLVILAESLGLVPGSPGTGSEVARVEAALEAFAGVGIGRTGGKPHRVDAGRGLRSRIEGVLLAVEDSPLPAYEWPTMTELFGADRLAELVGLSTSSVHRYRTGERPTPDSAAARLHFLALVTAVWRAATTTSASGAGSSAND